MQPLNSSDPYGAPAQQERDPNAILNDCRAVGRAIDDLQSRLPELERVQQNYLSGSGASNRDIDTLSADIMTGYRGLTERVRRIKGLRAAQDPRNRPQVDNLDRRIRKAITDFQQSESRFRRAVQDQQKRQYLIVNPDATEAEIREVTEAGGDQQIFQQALLNADRRGQAQSTLRNVQQRHDAIQQIERTMMELQQLFQDLDALVVEQEIPIQNIEQKAEETNTHLEQGTIHVGKAVDSARAARKKKWICLGICGAYWTTTLPALHLILTFSPSRSYHHRTDHHLRRARQQRRLQQPQGKLAWQFSCHTRLLLVLRMISFVIGPTSQRRRLDSRNQKTRIWW